MPIPQPKGNEELQEFMGRCLHELKHEKGGKRWPDHKQRVAICLSTYTRANESTNDIIDKWVNKLKVDNKNEYR